MIAENHVLRNMKGRIEYGLRYVRDLTIFLQGYVESDCAGGVAYRKRTSRCFFSFGFGMISWFNKKQISVSPSTSDA